MGVSLHQFVQRPVQWVRSVRGAWPTRWVLFACLLLPSLAQATHNLAGEITYTRRTDLDASGNTYEVLITTYTDPTAADVYRCFVDLEVWGQVSGDFQFVSRFSRIARRNGPLPGSGTPEADFCGRCELNAGERCGEFVRPGITRNEYSAIITLPGPGVYELRYYDLARIENVTNMSQSGRQSFYIGTVLNNNPFIGGNNSPILLNLPLDDACVLQRWSHNPGAVDPDDDSLAFSLIPSQQYYGEDNSPFRQPFATDGYQFPDAFGGDFTIDPVTGLIEWNVPEVQGIFNVAILIEEWRNGELIGTVIRDMAIRVKAGCNNRPPEIFALRDTCVRPGQQLNFNIQVRDPDVEDSIYFYLNNGGLANNGPFFEDLAPPQATFFSNINGQLDPTPPDDDFPERLSSAEVIPWNATISWDVNCEHLSRQPYRIDLYAHDDIRHESTTDYAQTLVDNAITTIKVNPPPLEGLTATAEPRQIRLNWQPNACDNALGYEIYRSFGSTPDTLFGVNDVCCEGDGLTQFYERIDFVDDPDITEYVDDGGSNGLRYADQYCYRVVARYRGGLRSCPSNEACVRLERDFILPLRADVTLTNDSTDPSGGEVLVAWVRPDTVDTAFFPPPYTYTLLGGPVNGVQENLANDIPLADTVFTHTGLNTRELAYAYQLLLVDGNGQEIEGARSQQATTHFLTGVPQFRAADLTWTATVPWLDTLYYVYQSRSFQQPFANWTLVDSVRGTGAATHSLTISDLENRVPYYFFIEARGTYNDSTIATPILNKSQIIEVEPRDTVPPCLPAFADIRDGIVPDCENLTVDFTLVAPPDTCAPDFDRYVIYYSRDSLGSYAPIYVFGGPTDTTYRIDGSQTGDIAGCYRISALDSALNESPLSPPVCIDNCPILTLPNVFTPNGDGVNDLLTPNSIRSVRFIEVEVYDRWGTQVLAQTRYDFPTEATQLWDGTTTTGADAVPGVYYWRVSARLNNLAETEFQRTGSILLLR